MTTSKPASETIFADPAYLLSDIDCEQGIVIFMKASAAEIRHSSFLDQRIKAGDKTFYHVALADFMARPLAPQADYGTRYIFHTSHVGSTLVAKLLGIPAGMGVLREPFVLRKLSVLCHELDQPEARLSHQDFERMLANSLALLSRRRPSEDRLLIKCTSYANTLAAPLFRQVPEARGIALYLPLRAFITTIFNSQAGWLDIRQQAQSRLQRLHRLLDETPFTLHRLQPGELVAMSWVCEMLTLHRVSLNVADHLEFVNFELFLHDITASVREVAAHLKLDFTDQNIEAIASSKEVSTYSKGEHAYNAGIRAQQLEDTYQRNAALINDGLLWLDNTAARFAALHPLPENFSA